MRTPALAVFLYYLALMGSCGAGAKEVPGLQSIGLKVLLVQACEVRLLTPESVLSASTSQGSLVTVCIWYPAT